ncbi:MAG: hypothetical protein NTX86_03960 [Candidatus Dependentiae bacterium]|nr:hypothetical protein [Candidatus Dependentiae bacterium]
MTKTLTKHGDNLALIIDQSLLKKLKINQKTELELSIKNGTLIIKPIEKPEKKTKSKDEKIDEVAKKIMKKYASVFKKLAKP